MTTISAIAAAAEKPAAGIVVPAASPGLADFAFWRLNAGWWQSENTYFDGALNYNIRAYGSLLHIEIEGRMLRQTEYKFYAPGKMATVIGRGVSGPDEGIETDTVSMGELVDDRGLVRITHMSPASTLPETTIRVLTDDTAVSITRDAAAVIDDYRMFITLPTRDKRYAANLGIIDESTRDPDSAHAGAPGDLRGFSLFRQTRVDPQRIDELRTMLRQKYNIHAVVSASADNAAKIERLQ